MKKRILSAFLSVAMLGSVAIPVTAMADETEPAIEKVINIQKISNPDAGEREVDGLIEGGDRENSYTWRLAQRGDYIYVATTRNIASALVNMYGGAFSAAGIDMDTFWAMIDVVTNGDIPRNDANEGANIISYNRVTGQFDVIYTAEPGNYFRMAVTFGDDVYFGSYSASPANAQYILKLDSEGNFTKVFETMGSVSLRANCVYDDHLFFAGADDREVVAEGDDEPLAKMAVLRKSNEDDTVWERVADYKDFGVIPYDSIMSSWAGAPIWELANHDGYIWATAPSVCGFVMYKGHPAAEGETPNEYGWYWEEVAGLNNGINNPGLSDVEGGEPGTMRSLIGSVFEFNGDLYAYNFDHSFGGEASAFAGMLQQVAGQDVKASDYLFYMYDSLHNPQKVWKLNDETGKFEECKQFTELMEGTTNEYVWRAGEYNGQMYIATMDAGVFYEYLTQLTNGNFFRMSKEERLQKLGYINNILSILAKSKLTEKLAELKDQLEQLKAYLEKFDAAGLVDTVTTIELKEFGETILGVKLTLTKIKEEIAEEVTEEVVENEDLEPVGAAADAKVGFGENLFTVEEMAALQEAADSLKAKTANTAADVKAQIEEKVKALVDKYFGELTAKLDGLYNAVDWKGIDMYLYINNTVAANAHRFGFDLYRTADGENFEVIFTNGMGDKYNYGCPSFLATEEGLYFGTCNPFYGGQLYLLTEEDYVPEELGDADQDGKISILDATVIQQFLAELSNVPVLSKLADVNKDGVVDINDVTCIQRFLAGYTQKPGA